MNWYGEGREDGWDRNWWYGEGTAAVEDDAGLMDLSDPSEAEPTTAALEAAAAAAADPR